MPIAILQMLPAVFRSIVEDLDGRLWAENNPDFGAQFKFRVPW
jgi:K+-sensing histidine kinase KdpD